MTAAKKPLNSVTTAKLLEGIISGLGKSQSGLAQETGIARVSLNRYLRGQSELRLSDFLILLNSLGVDIEDALRRRHEESSGQLSTRRKDLGRDLESVLEAMPSAGKKSYLGQVVAYAELLRARVGRDCYKRLKSAYDLV
jgi:transcriptional regulator with XRE-family HTH domain